MSREVQKWADPAMFAAEPMSIGTTSSPKVFLLSMTPDPLGSAAAMNNIYTGKVSRALSDVTHQERKAILADMQRTVLSTPLEAIKFHFLIEGVTRAFTHQLVRNRTSAYAQESMRFAVVGADGEEIPVQMPQSILKRQPGMNEDQFFSAQAIWTDAMEVVQDAYETLIARGVPAEDARGILPTNVLTRIHWVTDLRSLRAEAGKRLSTQAAFEWRAVIAALARSIREYNPYGATIESWTKGNNDPSMKEGVDLLNHLAESDRWQYEAISDLFRPICYQTGKCEFMASADRSCTIRDRVEANHAIGRPSSEWHKDLIEAPEDEPFLGRADNIEAISPEEWLADPTAAR